MHISSCLEPKTIWNPYLKRLQVVPCGKCSACLNARSARMVERLNVECTCHQYTAFVTLTYDNENLPILKLLGDYLSDISAKRVHPKLGAKIVDLKEELYKIGASSVDIANSFDFVRLSENHFGGLPYLSSLDIQRWLKRLRKTIATSFKQQNYEKIVPQLRYFCAGEIGPTTFRPHYHVLLFFTSEWLASHLSEFVAKTWQFGNIDFQFVEHSASSYVAQYLNCTSHLPLVYQTSSLRPFALYSKHPAIGTLVYSSEDIRQMFFNNSTEQIVWKQKKSLFDDVPLWRTLRDRLYPRIAYFDFIDTRSLCRLYGVVEKLAKSGKFTANDGEINFNQFVYFVEHCDDISIKDYISLLNSYKGDYDGKLQRWFYISSRVFSQSMSWNITVSDYVKHIVDFYNKAKLENLNRWYRYCEEYTKEHDVKDLFFLDPLYLREFLDQSLENLTQEELCYLNSFGIDLDKFFSDDLEVRVKYQMTLFPENTYDFKVFSEQSNRVLDNSTKTKRKNDYAYSKSDWYVDLLTHGFQADVLLTDSDPDVATIGTINSKYHTLNEFIYGK